MLNHSKFKPLLMWLLPLSFFAYQFILRLMPGLVVDEVISKFQINAADFGFMSSLYYWGYAGMQIPIAVLLDRYSPRIVISASALLTALGTLLFIYSDTWTFALLGRFAIGVGSAVGFLGTSKVLTQWFPSHNYSWYVGLTFSVGLLGAVYGGKPVASLVEQFAWQNAFAGIAFFGLALTVIIYSFLRAPENQSEANSDESIAQLLVQIARRPALWILALCNLLMVGPLEGFADVWGVTYFIKAFLWDKTTAAGIGSFIYIGMLFGGPFLSYTAKHFKSESFVIVLAGLTMGCIFCSLFLTSAIFHQQTVMGAMFIIGLFCCYQVLVFSVGTQMVSDSLKGITVAFLNCINMVGGAFYHTLIGFAMDMRTHGNSVYSLIDYKFALSVIPIGCFIGAFGIVGLIYLKKRFLSEQIS